MTAHDTSSAAAVASAARASAPGGHYRWVICALLFFATTINYVDRQVIAILKPTLQELFAWTERDYAAIVFTFQLAYAIGLLVSGRVMDKLGTRVGFMLAIVLWSVAASAARRGRLVPVAAAADGARSNRRRSCC